MNLNTCLPLQGDWYMPLKKLLLPWILFYVQQALSEQAGRPISATEVASSLKDQDVRFVYGFQLKSFLIGLSGIRLLKTH